MVRVLDNVVEDVASKAVYKLVQTVAANIDLVHGIGSAIQDLTSDIETFNARLVDASMNPRANQLQVVKVVVKKFRAVVNEAQDAIAKYIALNKKHEDNALAKCLDFIPFPVCENTNVCANEIRSIRTKVNALFQVHEKDLVSLVSYKNNAQDNNGLKPLQDQPIVEEDYVIGFEDDLTTIKTRLIEPSNNIVFIPIVGIPGTGKTTFAYQIFKDPNILNKFVHPIWVHVSQSFDRRQKFIEILCQITKRAEDFSKVTEDQLKTRIKDLLKDKRYLIVLDDIWEKKDLDSLKVAFPNNSQGSRVLVTTRFHNVVDSIGKPHILEPLDPDVSWRILEMNIFGKEGCCNDSLKTLGEEIAKRCNGLPLALVVVAGILQKTRTHTDWKRVAENPFLEINRKDQSYHKLVMLSYNHLPHEKLRDCFLYFAYFPMGHEIATSKLIHLWIAEEFIPTIDEWGYTLDLEVEAENYLKDLVVRNLVVVMQKKANGQIKTCRIHDSLYEFCKSEAGKKNLFHIMDGGKRLDVNTTSLRRLCYHSSTPNISNVEKNPSCYFLNYYNKKKSPYPSGEHVHSLLVSSLEKSDVQLNQEQLRTIPNAFPLLRVLDIESLKLNSLPDELFSLYLLKYLAITTNLKFLPKRFKNLRELQTLVFKTTESTLEIDGGIWNMEKLRHVHTNTSTQLPSPQKESKSGYRNIDIRTLSTISPASCRKEIFIKTPKLQKLGVCGDLVELLEEMQGICLFNNLQMLDALENLKLRGQSDKMLKVPKLEVFPPKLRKLTLSNTQFDWNGMIILGLLEELQVLKLDHNAFIGELWNLKDNVVFKQLQYLRIGRTNLVTWKAEKNNFPVLENLILRNCSYLEEIPYAFVDVHSLTVIELYHVSEKAVHSARKVYNLRQSKKDATTKGFDLFITSLPSEATPATAHAVENVNTGGFDLASSSILPPPTLIKMAPMVEEENVVGFDNEVKIIKDRLYRESMKLTVILIVGMVGVGKTTLAKMLFNDGDLQYEFFTRLWVDVSRVCNRKQIFLDILSHFTKRIKDFSDMSDENLAEQIKSFLEGGKYFIVLDDVCTKHDWECLKIAFPDNTKGNRILVTTRYCSVASHVDSTGIPHQLKFLRNIECWELIKKKVFGDERCLTSLESVGRSIAKKCNGLPLAVVLIIPVLRENRTLTEWGRIAKDPFASIDYENQHYNPLMELMDSQLKDCFLYLAAFPMRLEIDAGKLIHLWMAEGFIPEGELEHTAEKFLNDFVQRNLLIVSKRRADGRIKTVSIHELLHAICIREAAKQNFIREFDVLGGVSNSTFTKGYRRLSVHSSVLQDLSEIIKPSSIDEQVQSFLYFSSDTLEFPKAPLASIPNSFPNLKVLDIRSVEVPVPKEFYRLQHLAYLGISVHFNLNLLPVEFGNLSQLQTLVLHSTTQSALKIEADIWSMPKLRHVLSNTPVHLPTPIRRSTNSSGSAHIRTLSTISPTSCTGEILDKTPNLQKLGIQGNIVEVMESKKGISLFDNLQKLRNLENLKLLVHTINGQSSLLRSFPRADKFPRRLRKLTLSNTSFEWKDLCVLGALNELEVLKLEEYALKGEAWELKNVVFRCLKFLRIGRTNLAHWTTSKSCFPVLKTLIIRHCAGLTAVPSDFADVHSLELLELFYTNKAAVNSARDIEILKHERGNAHSSGFKLSIYPSDH